MSETTILARKNPGRHPEVLVAPVITFLGVLLLLFVARIYEQLPIQAPDCSFKANTGIPCVGCGGTRSMQSLAVGEFLEAIRFNPAVVLGVFLSGVWFTTGLLRFLRSESPRSVKEQNRRLKQSLLILLAVLLTNWIYLITFLE